MRCRAGQGRRNRQKRKRMQQRLYICSGDPRCGVYSTTRRKLRRRVHLLTPDRTRNPGTTDSTTTLSRFMQRAISPTTPQMIGTCQNALRIIPTLPQQTQMPTNHCPMKSKPVQAPTHHGANDVTCQATAATVLCELGAGKASLCMHTVELGMLALTNQILGGVASLSAVDDTPHRRSVLVHRRCQSAGSPRFNDVLIGWESRGKWVRFEATPLRGSTGRLDTSELLRV